jgi:hypothetical protein
VSYLSNQAAGWTSIGLLYQVVSCQSASHIGYFLPSFLPSFLSSFLSALQLKVSFGLLNNLPPFFSPSEADYVVSEQLVFMV